MRGQLGMTIIEVLVALLVLTVGLLGTVAAAGAAARLIADGHRHTRLAAAATGILEELHDTGCVATDGDRVVAPFEFAWTVERSLELTEIRLIGEYHTGAGTRQVAFVEARWCP